jgi:hypothetical protein
LIDADADGNMARFLRLEATAAVDELHWEKILSLNARIYHVFS